MDLITYAMCKGYADAAVAASAPTNPLIYKGSVETLDDLPTGANIGDVYNVKSEFGKNYAWNGTDWDDLGGDDIKAYVDEQVSVISDQIGLISTKLTEIQEKQETYINGDTDE